MDRDYQIYQAAKTLADLVADRVLERVQSALEGHREKLCTRDDISRMFDRWEEQRSVGERSALLQAKEVAKLVGLSKTMIWRLEREGKFPKRVQLGDKRVAWPRAEVEAWIRARPTAGA
jgi:prophage regulatory protein